MTTLNKVAILTHKSNALQYPISEILTSLEQQGIVAQVFQENDTLMTFQPDCVILTSPQHAKLTPFPTYGLIDMPRDAYLSTPRFLRNIMTYDGYLTLSPRLNTMLRDIMFGARKLNSSILKMGLYPLATKFKPSVFNETLPKIAVYEPYLTGSRFSQALSTLLTSMGNVSIVTHELPADTKSKERYKLAAEHELTTALQQFPIVICLDSGDNLEQTLHSNIMRCIASGSVVIAHHTRLLEQYFKDSLYYIPEKTDSTSLAAVIQNQIDVILSNPSQAVTNAQRAHQLFVDFFAFDKQFSQLQKFHDMSLIDKGYIPHPDAAVEAALPSVTYIIRTGGKHRAFLERTLDCLVAQHYPDLRALFVIHARFDYIDEIIAQYPSLKIKVIESIKSRRSEAIRDGMAAIETDLFGLFDDDDELYPNHVRTLVKTLQYHSNRDWRGQIGMVYSGSVHADDTYVVEERREFQDHLLERSHEKRALEHFRFYSSVLMSAHSWFMPNGWLARKSIIDDELLVDPELDTCEDLYFELQIAQRAHLAFSVEVSAVHNFHHLGNSTIDDSYKHAPDTQRIALRNFTRVFPTDSIYDDADYALIGKFSEHDPNQIGYQDRSTLDREQEYYQNQFFPFRKPREVASASRFSLINRVLNVVLVPLSGLLMNKFKRFSASERRYYIDKFKTFVRQKGWLAALKISVLFLVNLHKDNQKKYKIIPVKNKPSLLESYYHFRVKQRYQGLWRALKMLFVNTKNPT